MNGPAATETTIASSAVAAEQQEQQREPRRVAAPVDGRAGRDEPEPRERERRDPGERGTRIASPWASPRKRPARRLPDHAAEDRHGGEARDRDAEHVADPVRVGGEPGVRDAAHERDRAEPAADVGDDRGPEPAEAAVARGSRGPPGDASQPMAPVATASAATIAGDAPVAAPLEQRGRRRAPAVAASRNHGVAERPASWSVNAWSRPGDDGDPRGLRDQRERSGTYGTRPAARPPGRRGATRSHGRSPAARPSATGRPGPRVGR